MYKYKNNIENKYIFILITQTFAITLKHFKILINH